jgi:acyl carrier protein
MTRAEQLAALRADVDALAHTDEATVLAALPQWDSLAILLVVSHYEHAHDREITGAQVRACRTVADLLNLLAPLT